MRLFILLSLLISAVSITTPAQAFQQLEGCENSPCRFYWYDGTVEHYFLTVTDGFGGSAVISDIDLSSTVKFNGVLLGTLFTNKANLDDFNDLEDRVTTDESDMVEMDSRVDALEGGSSFDGAYGSLTGVPSTFTPAAHVHAISDVTGLQTALNSKFTVPTGTTSQYVRGDGSLAILPTAGTRTFNYPSRTLSSCFQISATQDADFHYKVDIATGLSLTSGAQGTVTATTYNNSGCTTGAQVVADGASAQTGTLVVGLGINQTSSVSLDGTVPAGRWLRITTANTIGTPTFTLRSAQAETLLP